MVAVTLIEKHESRTPLQSFPPSSPFEFSLEHDTMGFCAISLEEASTASSTTSRAIRNWRVSWPSSTGTPYWRSERAEPWRAIVDSGSRRPSRRTRRSVEQGWIAGNGVE
ncbi:hypothetical protein TKK_0008458 [Trichogramma kaykai]